MKIPLLLFALAFAAAGQTKQPGANGPPAAGGMDTNRVTFTNLQGRLFSNVMVVISDPASINVLWSRGTIPTRIDFTNLPKDIQRKFHYDPDAADDFRLRDAAMKEGEKAERDHSNTVRQLAIKTERRDIGQVVQITTNGLLARIFQNVPEAVGRAAAAGRYKFDPKWPSTMILVWHYSGNNASNGQYLILTNYNIGTFQTNTVNNNAKPIPKVTLDLSAAIDYQERGTNLSK